MAKGTNWTWLILAVIIVAALFALPSGISALGKGWSDFWSDLWAPFGGGTTPSQNGTLNGNALIGLKVYFTDGTSTIVDAPTYTIVPLSIPDPYIGPKPILKVDAWITSTTVSNYKPTQAKFTGTTTIYTDAGAQIKTSTYSYIDGQKTQGATGWETLMEGTILSISAAEIANAFANAQPGQHYLSYKGTVTITMDFVDDAGVPSHDSKSADTLETRFYFDLPEAGAINSIHTSVQVSQSILKP